MSFFQKQNRQEPKRKKKKIEKEEKEDKSQTKQMPHRSICSSQNFERQPGEIPCKPSLCSHRNSLPLTFAWDQLNHARWSYFPFQLYTSRLQTSKRIIRDKQVSTFLSFLLALEFMVGDSCSTQWSLLEPPWSQRVMGRSGCCS